MRRPGRSWCTSVAVAPGKEEAYRVAPGGHPVHRSKAVKAFAESTGGRLRRWFLPGYAPELNPDAWVWKHVKHDRIGRVGVSGPEELKAKALAALHRRQQLPEVVRSFFRDPNLRYITA
jgi:transposase